MATEDQARERRSHFNVQPELRYAIHRDWGLHYKRLNYRTLAKKHFNEAIEIRPNDLRSTLEKSKCNLANGYITDAIVDAQKCKTNYSNKIAVQLHNNECLYELNEFEKSLMNRSITNESFRKSNVTKNPVDLVKLTLHEGIGLDAGPCLFNMRKIIGKLQEIQKKQITHSGPLWKILLNANECDVVSQQREDELIKNNVNRKRKMGSKNKNMDVMLHDLYLDLRTSNEIKFLKKLKASKSINLQQTPITYAKLLNVIDMHTKCFDTFENMLWLRQPIYARKYAATVGNTKYKEINTTMLNYKKNEIRKIAFKHLVEIKKYANPEDFQRKLLPYAENALRDFFTDLTLNMFPRRFEFISEICNIISVCYLELLHVPVNVMDYPIKNRMSYLLDIPIDKKYEDITQPVKKFGDKSQFICPNKPDWEYIEYKKKSEYYAQRSLNAKYAVEKCYLYHEESILHLKQREFDAAKQMGKRIVEQGNVCGNYIWKFLGHTMILRCDVGMGNITEVTSGLTRMHSISQYLNNFTKHFVSTAKILNEDEKHFKLLQDYEAHHQQ